MVEERLKEIGYRLAGLNITFNNSEVTHLKYDMSRININTIQIKDRTDELYLRGFQFQHLYLQVLLHELAHYRQYIKYGKNCQKFFELYYLKNCNKFEKIADRYALMYYRRFVKVS